MMLLVMALVISLLAWMVIAMCRMHMTRQVTFGEDSTAAPPTWMLARDTHGGF